MAIFAVMLIGPSPPFATKLTTDFAGNFYKVSDTQWLVSATGTAVEISNRLGITDGSTGAGFVFATAGYFGRAPTDAWEWIKAKLEAPTANVAVGSASGTGSASGVGSAS